MDQRLKAALDFSNYAVTLNNQKRLLREQFNEANVYYYNGAQFTLSRELINFCQSLVLLNCTSTILIDDNHNPIGIDDLPTFSSNIYTVYIEAATTYLNLYNELKKSRSVEKLINYAVDK